MADIETVAAGTPVIAPEAQGWTLGAPPDDLQLSPHFKLSEFRSKDGVGVPQNTIEGLTRLCVEVLEPMRERFGVCNVTSGFRSEEHNRKVNGAPRSYHRYDLRPGFAAADVHFRSGDPAAWYREADRILGATGGAGRYNTFVHVDNRATRWRR